jgi:hypothetical protein
MKKIFVFTAFLLLSLSSFGQYSAIGVRGGLTVGVQNWSGTQRQPMLSYHADFAYEKFNSDKFSYLMNLGYHTRGSAYRFNNITQTGEQIRGTLTDRFDNITLMLGAKNLVSTKLANGDVYYFLGIRGEYTVNDSIETRANMSRYVNAINYGVTAGGGYQVKIADKMQMYFEVSFSPDFSNQLYSPSGTYVTNNGGNTFIQNFPEEKVTNLTIELSVGIKFFRY